MTTKSEAAQNAIQAVPAAAFIGAHFAGLTLQEWTAVAGIIFLVLQITNLILGWVRAARGDKPKPRRTK